MICLDDNKDRRKEGGGYGRWDGNGKKGRNLIIWVGVHVIFC